jgi:KDO2-lipid IV(A) lauroyltransferase
MDASRHGAQAQSPGDINDAGASAIWLRWPSRLPLALLYGVAAATAVLLRYVFRYRVQVARTNMQRCFPQASAGEINAMLGCYYRQIAQVAVEFVKLATMSRLELQRRVHLRNFEPVRAEAAAGRSVLLLAAHHCNWEWALQATALELDVPLDAAYKPLHGAAANRELLKLRGRFGVRMVAAKKLLREIARRRNEVHAIALMADQVPVSSGSRHWLKFLGVDTAFYPGPGEIAHMTGYASFFAAMRRVRRGHYEIEFVPIAAADERLDAEPFTARYARLVEAQIRAHPADWVWTHRRWKLQPPSPELPAQN